MSTRKRHAPYRMGEDDLQSDEMEEGLDLPPPPYEPVPQRPNERRSHKKRRVDPAEGFEDLGRPSGLHKGGLNRLGKMAGSGQRVS